MLLIRKRDPEKQFQRSNPGSGLPYLLIFSGRKLENVVAWLNYDRVYSLNQSDTYAKRHATTDIC